MRTRFSLSESRQPAPRVTAELDARALVGNYRVLRDLAGGQAILPMVKANGYGHGAAWIANQLSGEAGLYGFGVATLEEGAELRKALGPRGKRERVIVFSGAILWSEEKGQYCERHGLTPVIASDDDWKAFHKGGWPGLIPYELKFNTGMNRLGMSLGSARRVVDALKTHPATWHPSGIFSHLAMGENPDSKLSQSQRERFVALKKEMATAFPSTQFHLANSSALWNRKKWGLDDLTDVVRPGISLYGVPPWAGAPARGIAPVMTLKASVAAIHSLKPGESVGYGGLYSVPRGENPVRVAILSVGYGDGIHRMLGGTAEGPGGHVWIGGKASRLLGVVSMDLCAVAAGTDTRIGDSAELIGPNVDAWAQAKAAGTIPYELLTSVSSRVQRIYG